MHQKNFFQDKWTVLGLKVAHSHDSGSAVRIFLKFCRMKGAHRCMKILLPLFEKKILWRNLMFLAFRPIFTVWLGMVKLSQVTVNWTLNSQDTISVMITTGSLNSQDMIRILKQWIHDFSGKHLCDGHCMDVMWCLCVKVNINGFVKLL